MKGILWFVVLLPIIMNAQVVNQTLTSSEGQGIFFEQGLSWQQIIAKAKVENKYIFVDCYTTWCGPCKEMEKNIYPVEKVGAFFNIHFISVKVQMDTTSHDGQREKEWYSDARKIAVQYGVNAYPTFLFFSPDGKVIHRSAGSYPANQFIMLAKDAMDPAKQYYTLLANYHPEILSPLEMRRMADSLRYNGPQLAEIIATDYLRRLNSDSIYTYENQQFLREFRQIPLAQELADQNIKHYTLRDLKERPCQEFIDDFKQLPSARKMADQYISNLTNNDFREYGNILFVIPFLQHSTDIGFAAFYKNAKTIDSVVETGYAEKWIGSIIYSEEIDPVLNPAIESNQANAPNWEKLFTKLRIKYGYQYAGYCTSFGKCNWYSHKHEHANYFKSQISLYDTYGSNITGSFALNNAAWAVFLASKDTTELKEALSWSQRAVLMSPSSNWMDTYANLLYKLGRNKESIMWEGISVKLSPDDKEIESNFEKMNKGEATW